MARSPRPFDTLQLARALRDGAGFTGEHAKAAAVAIADWVDVDLFTRRDRHDRRRHYSANRGVVPASLAVGRQPPPHQKRHR